MAESPRLLPLLDAHHAPPLFRNFSSTGKVPAGNVQPLFVSVDPERDTPEALAEYVPQFHPAILRLTGTPEQIEQTARNFAIYKERVGDPSAPDGYTVGHTSSILLFDPEVRFVRLFEHDASAEDIAGDLRARVQK